MNLKKMLWMAAVAAMSFAACTPPDNGETPDGGGEDVPVEDIVDQVSQYEARAFDGEKRADVFYEIYVRSFADSDGDGIGDFNGVTAKLDYLNDLGIAGIWLMPIYSCTSEHGYDVVDYELVNPDYGTMADMERLIAEAHKRDIRVILDFVPNHSSWKAPWFISACSSVDNEYRNFYHFSENNPGGAWHQVPTGTTSYWYHGDFDKSMPDLNYGPAGTCENNATFKAMVGAAKFWVDKGVDGFRLDAVKHIYSNQVSNENPTFLKKFYDSVNAYFQGKSTLGFKDVYMVGECWLGTDDMAKYYTGLPSLFDFTAWENRLLYAIQNSHAKWFPKDMIAERNVFANYRKDFIQATKLSNHDEVRARTALGGGSLSMSLERSKMAAAVLLTSCGSPFIYYGEEIGMMGDKTKPGGDRNVREPMMWAPKAKDTFRPTWITSNVNTDIGIGNVEEQSKKVTSIYNVYRKFLRLRNTYPALAYGEIRLPEGFDDSSSENKQVMVFHRVYGGEHLLVVHNVSATKSTYTYKGAIKQPIADMNKVTIESNGANEHVISLPAYSSIIIEL